MRPNLSVVIPFYNEGRHVKALFERLVPILETLGLSWEVICVDDGSADDTLDHLIEQNHCDPRIKVLDLSRNFGKDAALSAGLFYASGRAVIPMDGDLQHPPELIPAFVAKWREGYEMVYAVRRSRRDQGLLNRFAAKAFYWFFRRLSEVSLPEGAGDFRLLDRKVVDALNRMPERNRFMKGIFAWIGFRQTAVPYDVAPRSHGATKWNLRRLTQFGLAGITAFSNFPLRVWGMVGAIISSVAFIYIMVRVLRTLLYGIDVPGYESIIIAILFLGGMQLLTLGIIGDYLGRVFEEVKQRPLYVVREAVGIDLHGQEDQRPAGRPPTFEVLSR